MAPGLAPRDKGGPVGCEGALTFLLTPPVSK